MPGFSSEYLTAINNAVCDDPERVINDLDLPWEVKNGRVDGVCSVHNGDKLGAFTWYLEGNSLRGNWVCRTHICEKVFVNSAIGLVRGVLSGRKFNWTKFGDRTVPFREVVDYLRSLYNIGVVSPSSESEIEKKDLPVTSCIAADLVTQRKLFYFREMNIYNVAWVYPDISLIEDFHR